MSATVPRHDVVLKHAAAARRRLELMADLVGMDAIFVGEQTPAGTLAAGQLYPERVGCGCRVVSVNETEERCPLVVEWDSGQRGIAEPEWLTEVAGA